MGLPQRARDSLGAGNGIVAVAIVKTSAAVAAISGKAGGAVYKLGKGATVMAQLSTRTRATSQTSMLAKNRRADIVRQWRALTNEQRNFWNQQGLVVGGVNRFGTTRTVTGFNAYMQWMNVQAFYSIRPDTPGGIGNWPLRTYGIEATVSGASIRLRPTAPTTTTAITGTVKFARSFRTAAPAVWRNWKTYWSEASFTIATDASSFNFWDPFVAALGAPGVGEYIAIDMKQAPLLIQQGPRYRIFAAVAS